MKTIHPLTKETTYIKVKNNYFNNPEKRFLKLLLIIEFTILYGIIPLFIYLDYIIISKMTILFFIAVITLIILTSDPMFDKNKMIKVENRFSILIPIFYRFLISAIVILFALRILNHETFNIQQFKNIFQWIYFSFDYLVLSVIPQELLYRVFLFHRYSILFKGSKVSIIASSFAFSFVHIVYGNLLAVIFTFIGGYFFSVTYQKSRSLPLIVLEHLLYGLLIFSFSSGDFLSGEV